MGLRYVFSEIEKLRLAQMTCHEGVMAVAKMLVAPNSSFHHPTKAQGKLKWSHIKKNAIMNSFIWVCDFNVKIESRFKLHCKLIGDAIAWTFFSL